MCSHSNKDDCFIKKVKQITRGIIGGIIVVYLCLIILANIPFFQTSIGNWVADSLSQQVGTEVKVGKVNLGLFNRLIIDDIYIADQEGRQLIRIDRASVRLNFFSFLLSGKINIYNAQLFGPSINIIRHDVNSPTNIQFLIDAFSSDSDEPSAIDLRVNTFIMRRGSATYNVENEIKKASFDPNHISLNQIDATLSLKALSADSINLAIKRLNFTETNSNLQLKNLQAIIEGNDKSAVVSNFILKTYRSSLTFDQLTASYPNFEKDKSFSFATKIEESYVTLADFEGLIPEFADITTPLYLNTSVKGNQDRIDVDDLLINTDDKSLIINLSGNVSNLQGEKPDFYAVINQILLDNDAKSMLFNTIAKSSEVPSELERLGDIDIKGSVYKNGNIVSADVKVATEQGALDIDAGIVNNHSFTSHVTTPGVNLSQILDNAEIGNTSFDIDINGNISNNNLTEATVKGKINEFVFKNHSYSDISIEGTHSNGISKGAISISDELANLDINGLFNQKSSHIEGNINCRHINPHALNLTESMKGESYSIIADLNLDGTNLNNLTGTINMRDLSVYTPDTILTLNQVDVNITESESSKTITLRSDFAEATLNGDIQLDGIIDAFTNQVASHLPSLVQHTKKNTNKFDFSMRVAESDFLKHFVNIDYVFDEPINVSGHIDAIADTLSMNINAPRVSKGNTQFISSVITCSNTDNMLSLSCSSRQKSETGIMQYLITADANDDKLQTLIQWADRKTAKSNGMVYATTEFAGSLGQLTTKVNVHQSQIMINDTLWHIAPSDISITGKHILCNNINLYNDDGSSINISGTISERPNDSLIIDLKNIEVAYITEIVDFDAVRFKGLASGQAVMSNIYDDIHLNANLTVNDLHLQEGRMGTAYIKAFWDNEIEAIKVDGHIVDYYKNLNRTTDVSGFIAPSQNDIDLKITTHDTNAEFLNGFLGSTFRNISGNANGVVHVLGPLNDVNLVGDISADVAMRLRATDVMYHINPYDTIRLRPYQFEFHDIRLSDNKGSQAIVNGTLAHRNMKNFKYDFDIDMKNLTIYDEHEFNSDKFYATVYADAKLAIHGSDGHPLRMSADVTPTKGSVFAYDAATPDAISTGSFVEFRDITPKTEQATSSSAKHNKQNFLLFGLDDEEFDDEDENTSNKDDYEYDGDIFMDISMHINPDCEIKLRMDNVEDGYMSTHGNGTLLAHYHNKSPFSLNGIYHIEGGKYRLYLQDIIYRDLELQDGSNVVFNGNPFDANIHLICHHTINSVPLRDITSDNTFSQNSKVKVVCVLDITGKLGNMNFGFDILLPNVNDETRQLVKSLITTEDEMNMQMIYLLGLGRFYSNEYARANGDSGSDQAMNTLLSSTISGQINQMLSNVIGQDSKWNFGTGLSTGEKGWDDLDVEGILSGRLINDRLLINGNFGYRDNAMTNSANFIGDFDVKWRLSQNGNTYLKAYNMTNDRYFTKTTLNTQGFGLTYQRNFDSWKALFRKKMKEEKEKNKGKH